MSDHDEDVLDPALLELGEGDDYGDFDADMLIKKDLRDEEDGAFGFNLDTLSDEDVM